MSENARESATSSWSLMVEHVLVAWSGVQNEGSVLDTLYRIGDEMLVCSCIIPGIAMGSLRPRCRQNMNMLRRG